MNYEDKIQEVYQYLIDNKIKPSKQDSFTTRAEIAFFVLSILCFTAFVFIGLFIAKYRNIGFALAAISIMSLLIFLFVKEIFLLKYYLLNQTEKYLKALRARHNKEIVLIDGLSKFDTEILEAVENQLCIGKNKLDNLSAMMIGALDKVGFLPAIATLYFAYARYRQNSEASTAEYILVAIAIGIYIGAISIRTVVTDIEELSRFVKEAANKSKQRRTFTMPEKQQ